MNIRLLFLLVFIFALLQNADLLSQDSLLVWSKWIPDVSLARFSPDNTKISLLKSNSDILLKIPSGEVDDTLKDVGNCVYSQDGKYLVCGLNKLRVFDAHTNQEFEYFENDGLGVNHYVFGLSISPNNHIAGMYSFYGTNGYSLGFRIWDLNTGKIIKRKEYGKLDTIYHTGDIYSGITAISYANNGNFLFVYKNVFSRDSKNNPIKLSEYMMILDPNTLDSIGIFKIANNFIGMNQSRTGKYIAYINNVRVRIYDFETDTMVNYITTAVYPEGVKFTSGDEYFGLTGDGINIYRLLEKQPFFNYKVGSTVTLDFSYDNKYIFISTGGDVYLYKLPGITSVSEPKNTINATIIYPNPANNKIILSFHLERANITKIRILDLSGKAIKIIQNSFLIEGDYQIPIDLSSLPSGNYFIHIESGIYSFTQKIIKNG